MSFFYHCFNMRITISNLFWCKFVSDLCWPWFSATLLIITGNSLLYALAFLHLSSLPICVQIPSSIPHDYLVPLTLKWLKKTLWFLIDHPHDFSTNRTKYNAQFTVRNLWSSHIFQQGGVPQMNGLSLSRLSISISSTLQIRSDFSIIPSTHTHTDPASAVLLNLVIIHWSPIQYLIPNDPS